MFLSLSYYIQFYKPLVTPFVRHPSTLRQEYVINAFFFLWDDVYRLYSANYIRTFCYWCMVRKNVSSKTFLMYECFCEKRYVATLLYVFHTLLVWRNNAELFIVASDFPCSHVLNDKWDKVLYCGEWKRVAFLCRCNGIVYGTGNKKVVFFVVCFVKSAF